MYAQLEFYPHTKRPFVKSESKIMENIIRWIKKDDNYVLGLISHQITPCPVIKRYGPSEGRLMHDRIFGTKPISQKCASYARHTNLCFQAFPFESLNPPTIKPISTSVVCLPVCGLQLCDNPKAFFTFVYSYTSPTRLQSHRT